MKFNINTFTQHLNNAKGFVGRQYTRAKNIGSQIDQGMMTARKIYSILAPEIEKLTGNENFGKINKQIMTRMTDYDSIKNRVTEAEDNVNRVVGNLQKNKINIGLN